MYGGTAKTYATWKQLCEPFEENKTLYINVENPKTKVSKKVRWYTDRAHAELMPTKVISPFVGEIFGFKDKEDYILGIRDRDITEKEAKKYFHYNWKKGGKWCYGMFFGGIWYAPKNAEVPPIANADRIFRITWPSLVKTAREYQKAINEGEETGFWFKEVE